MAIIQIEIPDEEHERFLRRAEEDGLTLGAWLMESVRKQSNERKVHENRKVHEPFATSEPFKSVEELEEFFRYCDTLEGPDSEPDWEAHLKVINESKSSGLASA